MKYHYNGEIHAGKIIETHGMSISEQKLYASFEKEFAIMCTARSMTM